MESAASWALYGFVKRGSHLPAAIQGSSLSQDWVPVPHFRVRASVGVAFENAYVPDAFGIQLLGPGYEGRVPDASDWTRTPAGAGGVILEHADPGAWFDGGLSPFRGLAPTTTRDAIPIPELVAQARVDFAGILFTNDVAQEEPAG